MSTAARGRWMLVTWAILGLAGCRLPDKQDLVDPDGDGWLFDEDCDDGNPAINTGATDVVDAEGTDQNCDGVDGTDGDLDGYASEVTGGTDCDDGDAGVSPGTEEEPYNATDDDCEEATPDDDLDGDGYGAEEAGGTDCDDGDASANPGMDEEPYNGADDDCEEATPDDDLDGDGYGSVEAGGADCDDGDASVSPGAEEICGDGVVNDCAASEAEAMAACGLAGTMGLSGADLKLTGESAGDYAGRSVSGAGDLDGDGRDDLLVGAYAQDGGGSGAGAVYLLLSAGALEGASGALSLAVANLELTGEAAGDYAGRSVSGTGDVDGDGCDDLLVGARGDGSGGSGAGAAYLLLGEGVLEGRTGVLSLSGAELKLTGEAAADNAGYSVSGAGDVDDDGRGDLLVGAYAEDSGGAGAGAAYLLLSTGVLEEAKGVLPLSGADLKLTGEAAGDWAGASVSGPGDVDGDGQDDLLIGAWYVDSGAIEAGAAYLLLGASVPAGAEGALSLAEADIKLTGVTAYDEAGYSVAGAGDVDFDGRDDLVVAACYEDSGSSNAGAVYVLVAEDLEGASREMPLSSAYLKLTGEATDDYAGAAASAAGDVDGDGRDDLLVGAYQEDSGGADAGAAYLLLSGGALEGASRTQSLAGADLKLTGEGAGDQTGVSVSRAGDVDGDGFHDLLIGAYQEDSGGADAGAAYLLFGGGY